jgi:hypothetical protein
MPTGNVRTEHFHESTFTFELLATQCDARLDMRWNEPATQAHGTFDSRSERAIELGFPQRQLTAALRRRPMATRPTCDHNPSSGTEAAGRCRREHAAADTSSMQRHGWQHGFRAARGMEHSCVGHGTSGHEASAL